VGLLKHRNLLAATVTHFLQQGVSQFLMARRVVLLSFLPSLSAPVYVMTGVLGLLVNAVTTTGVSPSYRIPDILMLLTNFGEFNRPNRFVIANSKIVNRLRFFLCFASLS
jgi:hypothetical protein